MTTLTEIVREVEAKREAERLESLRVLLAQARQAQQVVDGLRAGIRNIRSHHRTAAMSVAVDFASEMLGRFVAGVANEVGTADLPDLAAVLAMPAEQQSAIVERVRKQAQQWRLSNQDRAQAEEADNRG